jgi:Ribbon-helix-helix protein, copG family.
VEHEKAVVTTVTLPRSLVRKIDKLVTKGIFPSRADAVRYAVERLLKRYEG